MRVCVVSGSIGAGKSSILHGIEACTEYMYVRNPITIIAEDTTEWQFYLHKFYANPKEYAFLFQKEVEAHFHRITKQLEQLQEQEHEQKCEQKQVEHVVFVERSPQDVLQVFLPLNKHIIDPADYACLEHAMQRYAARPVWGPAVCTHYFIECPVETCIERIQQRGRAGEEHIDVAYATALHALYEQLRQNVGAKTLKNDGADGEQQTLFRCVNDICKDVLVPHESK